ncbi:MAG: hypothetical protein R2710_07965 [Acidimicrobiales bacterium]
MATRSPASDTKVVDEGVADLSGLLEHPVHRPAFELWAVVDEKSPVRPAAAVNRARRLAGVPTKVLVGTPRISVSTISYIVPGADGGAGFVVGGRWAGLHGIQCACCA